MTVFIALTGTPGTGKTSVSGVLGRRGLVVIDLNALAERSGSRTTFDAVRDTWEVDIDALSVALVDLDLDGPVLLDGHLSHHLPCERIVCLRCHPDELTDRLHSRGYDDAKVEENVWAEALGVIAVECRETGLPFTQLDTTDVDVTETADLLLRALDGEIFADIDWNTWIMDHS